MAEDPDRDRDRDPDQHPEDGDALNDLPDRLTGNAGDEPARERDGDQQRRVREPQDLQALAALRSA